MFKHPNFDIYTPETLPLDQDLYLRDEVFAEAYEQSLLDFWNGQPWEPVGYASYAVVNSVGPASVEISWFPNIYDRVHKVSVVLPREKIVFCVGSWRAEEKPSIFVKSDWYKQLHVRANAVFGLIDAIGVKNAINSGSLDALRLQALRSRIDDLASRFPEVSFVSWADSLVLKSNWVAGHFASNVKPTYKPEILIELFRDIRTVFQQSLGLNVYGVFTQGSNEYYADPVLHISQSKNHVCLNSLGAPFADLLKIDEAARAALRQEKHAPYELYLDEPYFLSLRLRFEFKKDRLSRHAYTSLLSNGSRNYVCTTCDEILSNFESSS